MGALAVALGVGTAAAGWPAVGWADPVDTATAPADTGPGPGETTGTPHSPGSPAPGPESASDIKSSIDVSPPASNPTTNSPSQSKVELGGGVVLSSSGGLEGTTKVPLDLGGGVALSSSGGAQTSASKTAATQSAAGATPTSSNRRPEQARKKKSNRSAAVPSAPRSHPHPAPVIASPVVTADRTPAAANPPPPPIRLTGQMPVGLAATPIPVRAAIAEVPTIKAAPTPSEPARTSVIDRAFSALLGSLTGSDDDRPADTPLMWAMLAVARRQAGVGSETVSAALGDLLRANSETVLPIAAGLDSSHPTGAADREWLAGQWRTPDFDTVTTSLPGRPSSLQFTPDSAHLLALLEAGNDNTLLVVNRHTTAAHTISLPGYPGTVVASPDGRRAYVVAAGPGGAFELVAVDTETGTTRRVPLGNPVGSVLVSPDSGRLYLATGDVIKSYDTTSFAGQDIPLPGLSDAGHSSLSPDGRYLYVTGRIESTGAFALALLDTETGRCESVPLRGLPAGAPLVGADGTAFVLTPTGRYGAAATPYHEVTAMDPVAGSVRRIPVNGDVTAYLQARDRSHIYVAYEGYGGRPDAAGVCVIDTDSGAAGTISLPGWGPGLAENANGTRVFASSYVDGGHQLSALDTPANRAAPVARIGNPASLVTSPDGARTYFIADTDDGARRSVTALDTTTNAARTIDVGQPIRLVVSPDSRHLLASSATLDQDSGSYRHELAIIDANSEGLQAGLIDIPGPVIDVTFSPDSESACVTSRANDSGFALTTIATRPGPALRWVSTAHSPRPLIPLRTTALRI